MSLLLARWVGRDEEMDELERAFHGHEISNRVMADTSAGWLAGHSVDEAWGVLRSGRWIEGMAETVGALGAARVSVLLSTITWSSAAEMLRERYGFDAVSGTEIQVNDGGRPGAGAVG